MSDLILLYTQSHCVFHDKKYIRREKLLHNNVSSRIKMKSYRINQ